MILSLSIKNYALIEDIHVPLSQGLTIITGETGAGKSILLGALSLLLGKRADINSVKDASKKCVIEGEFSLNGYQLKNLFKNNNLDYDVHTIIRREILPSGKSRAFVNDSPVGLAQLQVLGNVLVSIHSQQETNNLATEIFQLEVLDALSGNEAILNQYKLMLSQYNQITEALTLKRATKEDALKELDYNSFLYNELKEANLSLVNQKEVEVQYETLNNAEEIQESLATLQQLFGQENSGTLNQVKQARAILNKLSKYSALYTNLHERVHSMVLEMEDVFESFETEFENLEADPETLYTLNDTLQTIYKLQQKHSVTTVSQLLEIQESLTTKIDATLDLDTVIKNLEEQQQKSISKVKSLASQLHENRSKVVPLLIGKLEDNLALLGLPNAQFKFDIQISETFKNTGTDNVKVYFTANKGSDLGMLKKIASGGEMSRIMLSIKAILAQYKKLPTLVFDEIDTGVSGEIALKMAEIMSTMSKNMQLLSISHLPQIAAKGEHHIKVYKEVKDNTTITLLKQLTDDERIVEIAHMIGGKNITNTTLANAKELLN